MGCSNITPIWSRRKLRCECNQFLCCLNNLLFVKLVSWNIANKIESYSIHRTCTNTSTCRPGDGPHKSWAFDKNPGPYQLYFVKCCLNQVTITIKMKKKRSTHHVQTCHVERIFIYSTVHVSKYEILLPAGCADWIELNLANSTCTSLILHLRSSP